MAKLLSVKVDLTKIPKEKIYIGKKGKYITFTVSVNDEKDQYDNDVSVSIEQSKTERENKEPRTYVGNGRVVWSNDVNPKELEVVGNTNPFEETRIKATNNDILGGEDDLPF